MQFHWFSPTLWFKPYKSGRSCRTFIDGAKDFVIKEVRTDQGRDGWKREKLILRKLRKTSWAPKLVMARRPYLVMKYAGKPMTRKTRPHDWRSQVSKIKSDLRSHRVSHNSIHSKQLLVHHGKICLIDFGRSSCKKDWSCGGRLRTKRESRPTRNNLTNVVKKIR